MESNKSLSLFSLFGHADESAADAQRGGEGRRGRPLFQIFVVVVYVVVVVVLSLVCTRLFEDKSKDRKRKKRDEEKKDAKKERGRGLFCVPNIFRVSNREIFFRGLSLSLSFFFLD